MCFFNIPAITLAESTLLEIIQRRALRIIYRDEDSYSALLIKADLPKLSEHRKKVLYPFQPDSKSTSQTPPLATAWMNQFHVNRNAKKYEPPKCRTDRYSELRMLFIYFFFFFFFFSVFN